MYVYHICLSFVHPTRLTDLYTNGICNARITIQTTRARLTNSTIRSSAIDHLLFFVGGGSMDEAEAGPLATRDNLRSTCFTTSLTTSFFGK